MDAENLIAVDNLQGMGTNNEGSPWMTALTRRQDKSCMTLVLLRLYICYQGRKPTRVLN